MYPPTDFCNWPMDSDWVSSYEQNRLRSKEVADQIHLIHVTKADLAELILHPPPCLLVSDEKSGRSREKTIEAENAADSGQCLYFYAGRAYPKMGGAAIVFNKESEEVHTGSATPFDSGGLMLGHIHTNLDQEQLAGYCHNCRKALHEWRDDFGEFLAAYFSDLTAYWSEGPNKPDAAGMFLNEHNSWRAWTYEVRFYEPHNIFVGLEAWCAADADWERYQDVLEVASMDDREKLNEILSKALNGDVGITNYGEVVEEWVQKKVGLKA